MLLLSAQNPVPLSLNGTAREIWNCIDGLRRFDEIVLDLASRYETGAEELRPQVDRFLAELETLGLITRV